MSAGRLRVVYTDLDGTLLGQGGSLFRTASGGFTMAGAEALRLCQAAGVELSLVSGRSAALLSEDARLLGVSNYIGEAGCVVARQSGRQLYPNCAPFGSRSGQTVFEEIRATGAPALLLKRFGHSLSYHDPWYRSHSYSHLLRGHIATSEANALLKEGGWGELKLVDNGIIEDMGYGMPVDELHAYHLIPRCAGKRTAIELDLRLSARTKSEAIACGDSAQDLEMAPAVDTFYLMANAFEHDPALQQQIEDYKNLVVVEEPMVEGFLAAIKHALAAKAPFGRPGAGR